MYRFIQTSDAELRSGNPVLTDASASSTVLAAESAGPGACSPTDGNTKASAVDHPVEYRADHSILVDGLDVGVRTGNGT